MKRLGANHAIVRKYVNWLPLRLVRTDLRLPESSLTARAIQIKTKIEFLTTQRVRVTLACLKMPNIFGFGIFSKLVTPNC